MFKKKKQQEVGLIQTASSSWTNFQYGFVKFFTQIKQKVLEPDENQKEKFIVIQGKRYPNRNQAKKIVKKIIWFSYRKGFKISEEYKSDVGWGCLIRVGQMALASGLLKFLHSDSRMKQCSSQKDILESLIIAFSDYQQIDQKYSLNKIIEIAKRGFGHQPGQWFDMTKISYCLEKAQNKFPMKGTQNLQVVFFDQSVNIPKIFKILFLKQCVCDKKIIVCEKCHSIYQPETNEPISIKKQNNIFSTFIYKPQSSSSSYNMKKQKLSIVQQTKNMTNSSTKFTNDPIWLFRNRRVNRDLLLLVLMRVGDQRKVDSVNSAIFQFLDLRICLGIMTGFPKKAIFVVGRQENKLIYLNPHYVQQNESIFSSGQKQSYSCQQYLLTDRTQLDPTMSFCFYIQTVADLQLLAKTICHVNSRYPDCLSIGVDYCKVPFDPRDYQEEEEQSIDLCSNFQKQI